MKYLLLIILGSMTLLAGCENRPAVSAASATSAPPIAAMTPATRVTIASLMATETSAPPKVTHTDAEWQKLLTRQEYAVLRQSDTESPFTGKYDEFFQPGTYVCAACGEALFSSQAKFDSGTGWPSFYAALARDHIELVQDSSLGMSRTEVICANCGSHLGHLFDDAPQTPSGLRYCMNSVSLKFIPAAAASSESAMLTAPK